jgi:hypothetical protein
MPFSALTLRQQLVTILHSQIHVAFHFLGLATNDHSSRHEDHLARAKQAYDTMPFGCGAKSILKVTIPTISTVSSSVSSKGCAKPTTAAGVS